MNIDELNISFNVIHLLNPTLYVLGQATPS